MAGGQKKRRKRSINADIKFDGLPLHWELRSEPQWSTEHGNEGLLIVVTRADGSFRELILQYPIAMQIRFGFVVPKFFPQRPKISAKTVEEDIRQALSAGWNPQSRGKPFVFQVPNSHE